MAKQTINIGSSANDPTAEGLRSALDKVNGNFDELYGSATSWTPVLSGGTTAGTQSYTNQVGRYLRMNNLVIAMFTINLAAKGGTMAGSVIMTGLPVTPASSGGVGGNLPTGGLLTLWDGVTMGTGYTALAFRVRSTGGGDAQLIKSGGGVTASVVDAADLSGTARLRGFLVYEAA